MPEIGLIAPLQYRLCQPKSWYPFQGIFAGDTTDPRIEELAKHLNHIHRLLERTYVMQDLNEFGNMYNISIAPSGYTQMAPYVSHVWYIDHFVSDHGIKLFLNCKTYDNGLGSAVGVKLFVKQPDNSFVELTSGSVDSVAGWTCFKTQSVATLEGLLSDTTDPGLLGLAFYEIDPNATIRIKHATIRSLAPTSSSLTEGQRTNGLYPLNTREFDANSPLSVEHARELVSNLAALRLDRNSMHLAFCDHLQNVRFFLEDRRYSPDFYRLLPPIPIDYEPGTEALKYAICGYKDHAGDRIRIYTQWELQQIGPSGLAEITPGQNRAVCDPLTWAHWNTGTMNVKLMPDYKGTPGKTAIYLEMQTENGRDTGIKTLSVWE